MVHSSVNHRCFGDPSDGYSVVCRWSMLSLFSVVHLVSVGGLLIQFLVGHQGLSDQSLDWASMSRCC